MSFGLVCCLTLAFERLSFQKDLLCTVPEHRNLPPCGLLTPRTYPRLPGSCRLRMPACLALVCLTYTRHADRHLISQSLLSPHLHPLTNESCSFHRSHLASHPAILSRYDTKGFVGERPALPSLLCSALLLFQGWIWLLPIAASVWPPLRLWPVDWSQPGRECWLNTRCWAQSKAFRPPSS